MEVIALVALTFFAAISRASHIPNGWKTCKLSEPDRKECLTKAVTKAVNDLMNGFPAFGINPLDPIKTPELIVNEGDFRFNLSDLTVTGLKKIIIEEIETDWKTLKIVVRIPNLSIVCRYSLDGKFKSTPTVGEGSAEMVGGDLVADFRLKLSEKTMEGVVYNHIDESTLTLNSASYSVKFDSLGENVVKEMNDNWRDLWSIMKPSYEAGGNEFSANIASIIFDHVPKSELAPL